MNASEAIQHFIEGRLSEWPGLPRLTIPALSGILGGASGGEIGTLGASPAKRYAFHVSSRNATLFAWERDAHVILVEISPPPGLAALDGLPAPTAILPQEIRIEGAYAHEYFFAERGLLLTIARPLEEGGEDRLARCRGVGPMPPTTRAPGPDLYMPLSARIRWSG